MRVLQLIDSLEAGGAERVAVNIANSLAAKMERSYLCTTRKEGPLKASINNDVGYLFLNKQGVLDVQAIAKLSRFIKSEGIAIIHAHSTSFFLATLVKLRCPNVKIIWHDHYGSSEFLKDRPKNILTFCSRYFSHCIAVNSTLKEWATNQFKKVPASVLPNFAVQQCLKPQTQLHGIPGKRILHLANLRPQKDHITLLNAFKLMVAACPEWSLHLVGKDFEDDYAKKVKRTIIELGLSSCVFIYGSRTDSDAIIKQSDIGVLSSESEGLPLALLEYGLHALPVVTTNVGDCERVIQNEITGLLVPSKSEIALSEALVTLVQNESLRLQYANNLHSHINTHFSEDAVISQLVSIYNRSLS